MVGEEGLEPSPCYGLDPKSSNPFSPSQNPSNSLSFAAAWRVFARCSPSFDFHEGY